ncbi:hypothetical protein HJFPF1_01453 [Paramyrothecium foliicola]|nr:hypothetical protein HJFPF1_01453 [Paramyrothecium foliicola]
MGQRTVVLSTSSAATQKVAKKVEKALPDRSLKGGQTSAAAPAAAPDTKKGKKQKTTNAGSDADKKNKTIKKQCPHCKEWGTHRPEERRARPYPTLAVDENGGLVLPEGAFSCPRA